MRRPSGSVPAVLAGWLMLAALPPVVQAQAPAANAEVESSPTPAGGAAPASGADLSAHAGNEIDVTIRLPLGPAGLEVGYGRFFGGAYLRDADFRLRSADFFYLQTLVGI